MSVAEIDTADSFERGKPKLGGLADPRMGTMDRNFPCQTCGGNVQEVRGPARCAPLPLSSPPPPPPSLPLSPHLSRSR